MCPRWPGAACWRSARTAAGTTPGRLGRRRRSRRGFTAPDVPMKEALGDMEGEVNILAWPGYAEDGSTDRRSTG